MSANDWDAIFKESPNKTITLSFSDNSTITNSQIVQESLSLEEALCSEENLRYGACESSSFNIRIVNTTKSYKGMTVNVTITVDGVQNPITLGTYKVFSDIPTNDRSFRDLVCYDAMFDIINLDVAAWWNGLTFPKTVKQLRDSLFSYIGVTQETVTLVNDYYSVKGGLESQELSCRDVLESICELNGVFGHITPDGKFGYVSLPSSDTLTLSHYLNGTGAYEDYITDKITGIKSYSADGNIPVTVGTNVNPYIMNDNLLFYGDEGNATQTTAMTTLLNKIKDFQFRPFGVTTYGNPCVPLGTGIVVETRYQTINSFMMTRFLNGIQAMKDSYSAVSEKAQPTDINNTGTKISRTLGRVAKVEQNVDEIKTTVGNWTQGNSMASVIEQMADEIVLKVDTNGKIVKVALSANPSTGTEFKVSADNISFIANGKIELTSNSLEINSTYFKVDASGNITCTGGTIGGFTIGQENLEGTAINIFAGRSGEGYYVPGYISFLGASNPNINNTTLDYGGVYSRRTDRNFKLSLDSDSMGPYLTFDDESPEYSALPLAVGYYTWGIYANYAHVTGYSNDFEIRLGEDESGTLYVSGNLSAGDIGAGNIYADGISLAGDIILTDSGTTTRQIKGISGGNDYWRIAGGASATNSGWMEIATADDGNEPIYVRQYSGNYTTATRTLTLLDASGNTSIPNQIQLPTHGGSYISQKDTSKHSIYITTPAVTDGSRYDSIIGGKSTDGSFWNMGIINNTIYFGRYTSGETANNFTNAIKIPLTVTADVSKAINNITRSGTTFTATRADGTTFTFTQQDNNTTTGTSYNAGSCPDNTTFATNGSVARAYSALNSNKLSNSRTLICANGTYNTVNQTITLTQAYSNFKYLIIRSSSDTDQNSGGQTQTYIRVDSITSTSSQFSIVYALNGGLYCLIITFPSTTQCKIIKRQQLIGSAWHSGIREIYGIN